MNRQLTILFAGLILLASQLACAISSLESQLASNDVTETQIPVVSEEMVVAPTATAELLEVTRIVTVSTVTPDTMAEPTVTNPPQPTASDPTVKAMPVLELAPIGQTAPASGPKELIYIISGEDSILQGCFSSPSRPAVVDAIDDIEIHGNLEILVCGWRPDEEVTITLQPPEGPPVQQSQVSAADGDTYSTSFFYQTNVSGDRPGIYTITFEGLADTVVQSATVRQPDGPRMYFLDEQLVLTGFQSLEEVTITGYTVLNEIEQRHDGWRKVIGPSGHQNVNVDEAGQLTVVLDSNAILADDPAVIWYSAVGRVSGEAPVIRRIGAYDQMHAYDIVEQSPQATPFWPVSPMGIEACHLTIGQRRPVIEGARLWSKPNVQEGTRQGSVLVGTEIEVLEGPAWGRVRLDVDASGWWWRVAAGDDQGWLWQGRISGC